jgi:hypothetical protein
MKTSFYDKDYTLNTYSGQLFFSFFFNCEENTVFIQNNQKQIFLALYYAYCILNKIISIKKDENKTL